MVSRDAIAKRTEMQTRETEQKPQAASTKSQQRQESQAFEKEKHVQSYTRKSEDVQADNWNLTSPWTEVKIQWFSFLDVRYETTRKKIVRQWFTKQDSQRKTNEQTR